MFGLDSELQWPSVWPAQACFAFLVIAVLRPHLMECVGLPESCRGEIVNEHGREVFEGSLAGGFRKVAELDNQDGLQQRPSPFILCAVAARHLTLAALTQNTRATVSKGFPSAIAVRLREAG